MSKTSVFARDFLKNSHFKSAKRAFRTRLPSKFTRQVSKTSASFKTSSNKVSHMSKSPKRAFRTRLPPKVKREATSEHTHQAALPSSFAIPAPPSNTRSHANPNVTATLTSNHNLQPHDSLRLPRKFARPHLQPDKVLRLPRNVTSATPRNHLRLPRKLHFHTSKPAQSTVIIMLASAKFTPHHTLGMISTGSEHTPIHQYRHLS